MPFPVVPGERPTHPRHAVVSDASTDEGPPTIEAKVAAPVIPFARVNTILASNWATIDSCLSQANDIDTTSQYLKNHDAREGQFTDDALRSAGSDEDKRLLSDQRADQLSGELAMAGRQFKHRFSPQNPRVPKPREHYVQSPMHGEARVLQENSAKV